MEWIFAYLMLPVLTFAIFLVIGPLLFRLDKPRDESTEPYEPPPNRDYIFFDRYDND